ncbi:hypothetical protein NDU88_005543 [Pleurodeles waltl]|uniref:Uncharacterized protein n=1 Tax=Pleurodeles waltl TaxID=8319 RepID=A0AAV7RLC7_PLEWA|nr:hypothetical protein NDU88_005543 [Pleurodeles waltl]
MADLTPGSPRGRVGHAAGRNGREESASKEKRRARLEPNTEIKQRLASPPCTPQHKRAARAVVGTGSQHPDKRAQPPSSQVQDSSEEVTALKPRNSLHSKDKQNTTETSPPKVISHRPT